MTSTQNVAGRELSPLQSTFIHSFWFVVLMGSLTAFDPLSIDMYLPAFPEIQNELHTTYASVELSLSSFFIGMALGQIFYGPLADRFGRKRPLIAGMTLYMLASFACGFARSIEMLIVLRILQAFGGCAGMVITRAIALAHQGHQAGLASALFGTLQWSVAMFSSFMVSRLHNGTIFPMTAVMLGCGLISVIGFQILVGRSQAPGSDPQDISK